MSSPEMSTENAQSFVSRVWNYDDGKARWRALIMATVTTAVLTRIVYRHYHFWHRALQWSIWTPPGTPRVRHPGLPYYWIDTVVTGALIAILANTATAFFATASARRNMWTQFRGGVTWSLILPGLTTLCVVRQGWEYGNSPVMITLLLWLPLMLGAVFGVMRARIRHTTGAAQTDTTPQPFSSDSFHVSRFMQKSWSATPLHRKFLKWNVTPLVRQMLILIVTTVAVFRLVTFISGF